MIVLILLNNWIYVLFGVVGGEVGVFGCNMIEWVDGMVEVFDYIGCVQMVLGDVFVVEMLGGGGYGVVG